MRDSIIIERTIAVSQERVFMAFTTPDDLVKWHNAGEGWSTPYAEVDPQVGGKIKIGYADPEGKVVFDLEATIDEYDPPKRVAYYLSTDNEIKVGDRLVTVDFQEVAEGTKVTLEFDIENLNDRELQRKGWTNHIDNLQTLLESEKR
jgi:uncharacterized protein YndB with AHSA1/START domain